MQTPSEVQTPLRLLSLMLLIFAAFVGTAYQSTRPVPVVEEDRGKVAEFDDNRVEALAYVVLDGESGEVLMSKNQYAQLPLASVTKVMTAIVAKELSQQDSISISASALLAEGDSGLFVNEVWPVDELVRFMMLGSSNDAAEALAELEPGFVEEMNKKARELGLSQTYFVNPSGLDESEAFAGSYGSAHDMAKLMAYAIAEHEDTFRETQKLSETYKSIQFEHPVDNTNDTVNDSLGLIASKTGYTDLAGGNLVVAFDAAIGRPVVIAVLGSSLDGRFTDVSVLAERAVQLMNAR